VVGEGDGEAFLAGVAGVAGLAGVPLEPGLAGVAGLAALGFRGLGLGSADFSSAANEGAAISAATSTNVVLFI
jgi:hypothetical protein